MLNTQEFGDFLHSVGLKDFVGVPCSYLSPLINYAINEKRFIMSNNEGDAVAIASGISLGHSSCGDFLASASPCSLRRMPNTPHSQSLHSPKNSSAILECQGESLPKESHSVSETSLSESSPSDSNANTKSTHATYGIVLMQNSGLSNALSPLTSLNHTFKIPILGFVSLRGERDCNGKNTDEPQHELLGIITDKLLETCQVPYAFLDSDMERAKRQVAEALAIMSRGESFFFIVREGTFSKVRLLDSNSGHLTCSDGNSAFAPFSRFSSCGASSLPLKVTPSSALAKSQKSSQNPRIAADSETTAPKSHSISESTLSDSRSILESYPHTNTESPTDSSSTQKPLPTRLNALETIHTLALKHQALLLATTGKCGRELYEIKDTPNQLYMVGSMGCVSALSLGLSLVSPQKVIAIDGDSALLMRLGTLSTNAYYARGNFCHILLDNESHDSTGGQFNLSPFVSFPNIAKACGYTHVYEAGSVEELGLALKEFLCDSNSSLGNQFAQSLHPASLRRMPNTPHSQGEAIAQSNTANTRIVCGEILESKGISEFTADSECSAVGHSSTAIESIARSANLEGVVGAGGLSRGEGATSPNSSPSPLDEKEKEILKNNRILEVKAKDSEAIDLESENQVESTKAGDSEKQESKPNSYFIYLKIAKGSKENLGRPKITPQDVAKRLSAYMQKWRQNHAQAESSQNLADGQGLQNTTQNKACGNAQDSQTSQNSGRALHNETNLANDLQHAQDSQPQNSHTSHTKEQQ